MFSRQLLYVQITKLIGTHWRIRRTLADILNQRFSYHCCGKVARLLKTTPDVFRLLWYLFDMCSPLTDWLNLHLPNLHFSWLCFYQLYICVWCTMMKSAPLQRSSLSVRRWHTRYLIILLNKVREKACLEEDRLCGGNGFPCVLFLLLPASETAGPLSLA